MGEQCWVQSGRTVLTPIAELCPAGGGIFSIERDDTCLSRPPRVLVFTVSRVRVFTRVRTGSDFSAETLRAVRERKC